MYRVIVCMYVSLFSFFMLNLAMKTEQSLTFRVTDRSKGEEQ